MTSSDIWLITFSHIAVLPDDIETLCFDLIEAGSLGTHHISTNQIGAFVEGTEQSIELFAKAQCTGPLTSFSISKVADRNWVQECRDVLEDVQAGTLTIKPIMTASDIQSPDAPSQIPKNSIYIIPGLGFGTGHHETTRSALILLAHSFIKNSPPKIVLDVGTGSGILAIGASALYGCRVDAFDTDSLAVDNATENVSINGYSNTISVSTATIDAYSAGYDLVIANIYAEVLAEIENSIRCRLSPGKPLIISGIMISRLSLIEESYRADSWKLLDTLEENGWVTRLYERL